MINGDETTNNVHDLHPRAGGDDASTPNPAFSISASLIAGPALDPTGGSQQDDHTQRLEAETIAATDRPDLLALDSEWQDNDYQVQWADGTPVEPPTRSPTRRRGIRARSFERGVPAWGAEASSRVVDDNFGDRAGRESRDRLSTHPQDFAGQSAEAEHAQRHRGRRYLGLLAVAALVICLAGVADVVSGAGGGKTGASMASTQRHPRRTVTLTTARKSNSRTATTAGPASKRHRDGGRKKHPGVKTRTAAASHTSPTTPAAVSTTQAVTQSTPQVASSPPTSGTNSSVTTKATSGQTGSSKKSVAIGGAVVTGGLPDVQQTKQQP